MVWCQWFGVNLGFRNEDQILIENLYVFKGYGAKTNLVKNFWVKVGTARTEQTFKNAARNWHDEAATLKAYRIFLVVLFCNIYTQTGYYKKEICPMVANFLGYYVTKYY